MQKKQKPNKIELFFSDLSKPLIKLFQVVVVPGVLVALIFYFAIAELFIQEITAEDAKEIETFASMLPLMCSFHELKEHEDEFQKIGDLYDTVQNEKVKCSKSWNAALRCLVTLDSELDKLSKAETYLKVAKTGVEIYAAHKVVKNILRRTVQRAEDIEAYNETNNDIKKEIVSLAQYFNSLSITDIVLDGESLDDEVGERVMRMFDTIRVSVVEVSEQSHINAIFFIMHSKFGKVLPSYYNYLADERVKKAMMRSDTFRQARESGGCLSEYEDISEIFSSLK